MKKFIIAFAIVFIASLGCKKIMEKDGGICACSPIESPYLSVVIKNATGDDLLSSTTTGFYAKNQIQLFYKDANGSSKPIDFTVRTPFSYGSNKFNYNQIFSIEIVALAKSVDNVFYLKFGNNVPYELNLLIGQKRAVDKLFVNKQEAQKETGALTNYSSGNIFYLVQ